MPMPRKSTARAGSATPAKLTAPTERPSQTGTLAPSNSGTTVQAALAKRMTRAGSVVPSDSSSAMRGSRDNVAQDGTFTNPQLPELQTKQSFAYGSQKTPFLPEKLVAREKMSLQEMAETIDLGIRQAEQHFEAQAAEAEANFAKTAQEDARADRVRRRSESRESSVHSSRQGSVDSQSTDVRTTRRTAAWASSVGNGSHLNDIAEEGLPNGRETTSTDIEDEYTRKGSDGPSSFPSGNFDISYNQERGRFRNTEGTFSPARDAGKAIRAMPGHAWLLSKQFLSSGGRIMADIADRAPTLRDVAWSTPTFLLTATVAVLLIVGAWMLLTTIFCQIYTSFLCEYDTSSALHFNLQRFCGTCVSSSTSWNDSDSFQAKTLPSDILNMLGGLNKRIGQVESRLDAKNSQIFATLTQMLDRQGAIQTTVSDLQHSQPHDSEQSCLVKQINYCSAGNGAVIDPYLTSPTKQKQFTYIQRFFIGAIGMQRYQSNPPSEALRAWEEVGDCWCAAHTQQYAQLGVLMREIIYPTEVVIEHTPSDTSPTPGTAPKELEVWADFSHFSPEEFVDTGLDMLARDATLSGYFARIGRMTYKAGEGVPHVQTFKLDLNRDFKRYSTQKVLFRAISNHGAEHTCFYRVRLHGIPLVPHPQITVDGPLVS